MTVSSTTNRKTFAGNGVTTSFATSPVVFFDTSDLVLTVVTDSTGASETLVENTDYTVTGGSGSTGTASLAGGSSPYGAPASGTTLVIRRVLPLTQEDDFLNNDINDAEVLEDRLDRLTMIDQQQSEEVGRALKVPASEYEQDEITVAGKAGYYLRRNVAGTAFELAVGDANTSTFTQSGAGAVERSVTAKLGEIVSVKDFGAVGDGVTDDTAAIQAAIDYAKATSGIKCVEFPTANYATSASINIKGNFGDGLTVKGNKSTITCSGNTPVFDLNGTLPSPAPEYRLNVLIQDFTVVGSGAANTGSRCVQIVDGANVQINNCILRNAYKGLYGYGALICNFVQLVIRDNETGVEFLDSASFSPNDIHFVNCQIIVNTVAVRAVNFDYGSWNFYGCEIEGNNISGNATDGVRVCEFFNAGEVNFYGCHFESNPGQYNLYYSSAGSRHLNIIGCKMIPGDTTGSVIYMISGELFVTGTHAAQTVGSNIYLSSGVAAVIVGDTAGTVTGTLAKLTRLKDGKIQVGGAIGTTAGLTAKNSATGVAADLEGTLRFVDSSNTRLGYVTEGGLVSDGSAVIYIANSSGIIQFMRTGKVIEPGDDNTYTLGSAPLRWSTVYAGTGAINTSDERSKQQIQLIDEAVLRAWGRVNYSQFKFNDAVEAKGNDARWHFGLIAQRVKEAFESEGLDAFDYGLLCYDEWEDVETTIVLRDADGNVIIDEKTGKEKTEKKILNAAGCRYGIRYEEALALECAYLRNRLQ